MSLKKVLILASFAAFSTGCAVEAPEDANLMAAEEGDEFASEDGEDLNADEERALAQYVEAFAEAETGMGGASADDVELLEKDQAVFGSNSCKNVDLRIYNKRRGNRTKIVAVQYYSSTDRAWRYENLTDREVSEGKSSLWTPNLSNTKNDYITKWKVKYKKFMGYTNWGVQKWSSSTYSDSMYASEGTSTKCVKGRNYTLTLDDRND